MIDDMIASHEIGADIECHFDETTGILHLVVEGPIAQGKPPEDYLLKLIARHRRNRVLNGIVIFNRQAPRFNEVTAALQRGASIQDGARKAQ